MVVAIRETLDNRSGEEGWGGAAVSSRNLTGVLLVTASAAFGLAWPILAFVFVGRG